MFKTNGETDSQENIEVEADPWAAAFAAIGKKDEGGDEEAQHSLEGSDGAVSEGTDGSENSAGVDMRDQGGTAGSYDEPGDDNGDGGYEAGEDSEDSLGIGVDDIESYRSTVREEVESRAIREVADAYIKQGARHTNGRLGATINDADICKRDEDGVPRFYNPETGKEFRGDNPRRQAQEWVDDYNAELARNFNDTTDKYVKRLMEQEQPRIAVLEFVPKYDKLDPIRKAMFDEMIVDYEITDKGGELVGYSCDLDKALAAVDRQVSKIQEYGRSRQTQQQPSGPALDMKSTASVSAKEKPEVKSLADALLYQQEKQLEDFRNKRR